jgi:uncharacterized protein (DUF433 family)
MYAIVFHQRYFRCVEDRYTLKHYSLREASSMSEAALGLGIYTFREAARYSRLHYRRVWRWFQPTPGPASHPERLPVPALLTSDYMPTGGVQEISFLNLVDVFVFGQLREHGVRLKTLRRVYQRMRDDLGKPHPFAHQRVATDGREVFLRHATPDGRDELTEVLTRQRVMTEVIEPFLRQLDYEPDTQLAGRWRIADRVVLDPRISLGKPVVAAVGIKTDVLASAYHANDRDAERVAWWYNVVPDDVLAAVAFEKGLAA